MNFRANELVLFSTKEPVSHLLIPPLLIRVNSLTICSDIIMIKLIPDAVQDVMIDA